MNIIGCPICMGKGFVIVRKQNYDFKHHCTCRQGEPHKYDGAECVKVKSHYYCASVDELPRGQVDEIIKDNMKRNGIIKSGDRYLKEPSQKLTEDEVKQYKQLMRDMVGVML